MKFALVLNNQIKEYREYPSQPDCKIIDGLPVIRPVVEGAKPTFNAQTQSLGTSGSTDYVFSSGGHKSLSAELDRVSLGTDGVDTFDAGVFGLMYE